MVTAKAGQDQDGSDDTVILTHAATGGNYEEVTVDLEVTVTDDDRGIVFNPTSLTVTEGDADGEIYTVKLATQPSEDVTVTVSGQAGTDVTPDKTTLTFTTSNWDTAQTVTVKAAQDADGSDDTVTLTHAATGGNYEEVTADLEVTIADDDRRIVFNPTSLTVTEGDTTGATYTVKLATQPSEDVTVTVSGQASTDLTLTGLTGNALTFTTSNWNTAQTVTVKAVQDDDGSDDSVTLTHTAAGGDYAGTKADMTVTVSDNDRGIVFDPASLSVEEGDATGATYTVKLATEPSEEVTVTVSGQADTDLTLTGLSATHTLTFTTSNWNTAQTVTVKAGQDDDGTDDSVTLTPAAGGGDYAGASADLKVTVTDSGIDQTPLLSSVHVSFANSAQAIPEGGTATIVVSLSDALAEAVTIPLTKTNQAGAGDADYSGVPASLTFSGGDTEQSFTVSATADSEDEQDEEVVLGFGTLPEGVDQGTVS